MTFTIRRRMTAMIVLALAGYVAVGGICWVLMPPGHAAARLTLVGLVLALSLASIVVGLRLAHRVLTALADVSQVARAMAAGDLTVRAQVASDDEIGKLAEAANGLNQSLHGMVTQLGMSEKLGPLTWGRRQQLQYLGQSVEDRNYSEETAQQIDSEVKALVEGGHQRALQILTDHRALLDTLAGILEKQEVLAGDQLRSILSELRGECKPM